MSRSTQFIGLTKAAEEYLFGVKELSPDTFTTGMFEEKVSLRKWGPVEKRDRPNECIREVVQATPWSSGMMIFTCLEWDFGNGGKARMFEWINDPRVKGEVDPENGRMWV